MYVLASINLPGGSHTNLGPNDLAVLAFIEYKRTDKQTDRQARYIYFKDSVIIEKKLLVNYGCLAFFPFFPFFISPFPPFTISSCLRLCQMSPSLPRPCHPLNIGRVRRHNPPPHRPATLYRAAL